ncbi:MAG: hypothetical protein SH808_15700 [Saprospiraceae bacterium]|nr:hypothetical protein [Saprospiraceae bacterium]
MSEQKRFADPGTHLADLATHFLVHCPKCDGRALINPHGESWRLNCSKCFHVEEPGHWYGSMQAYVSVKCRECRNPLPRSPPVDGRWKKLKLKCDQCGDECEYEAHLSRHPKKEGLMCDLIFGLYLWLQKPIGDDLFWSYNYEQLTLLEQYVSAKLRERSIDNKGSKNSLMFSRLPTFITKAGNREEILKLIRELQLKVK